jgi:membrane protease YdiL (CAAX protease family)
VSATLPYPKISQAIWALLLYTLLLSVLQVGIQAGADALGWSLGATLAMGLAALLAGWLVLLRVRSRYGLGFAEMCPLRPVGPRALAAVAVATAGVTILASELENAVAWLLPRPAWLTDLMGILGRDVPLAAKLVTIALVAPLVEEALCRGLVLQGFLRRYSVRKSIVVSALLFALLHVLPWQVAPAFLAGLLLAWFVVRAGSLLPALLAHVLSNGWVVLAPIVFPWEIPGYSAVVEGRPFQPLWLDLLGVALLLTGAGYFHRLCPPRSIEPEEQPGTEDPPTP